jgi:hypothetical protein
MSSPSDRGDGSVATTSALRRRFAVLSADPDSTFVLPEHRPESLEAEAAKLESEAQALGGEDRDRLLADAAFLRDMASRPITWHLRRPDTAARLKLTSIQEHERDIGAVKGREVVRIAWDRLAWQLLRDCVVGVDNLPDDKGGVLLYPVGGDERTKRRFWDQIPNNWTQQIVAAVIRTFQDVPEEQAGN